MDKIGPDKICKIGCNRIFWDVGVKKNPKNRKLEYLTIAFAIKKRQDFLIYIDVFINFFVKKANKIGINLNYGISRN